MIDTDEHTAAMVREAIADYSRSTERTQQSMARLIGPSEVGGCRAYLAHVVAGTARDDMTHDVKWAAFVGTAVGGLIESAMLDAYEGVRTQVPVEATLPSGLVIAGNADIVLPDGVLDIKSVDGLEVIRRTGPSFQQRAQVNVYLAGLIQAGEVPPDATWSLVYVDRSGSDDVPVAYSGPLEPEVLAEIDARLEDVQYAAEHDLSSAPRDQPNDWCMKVCPFYSSCRGADEHRTSGLIEDEATLTAIKLYRQGLAEQRVAKALIDECKGLLAGRSGSTGEFELSWTHVPETTIETYVRAGYDRITLRPVKKLKTKPPASPAPDVATV